MEDAGVIRLLAGDLEQEGYPSSFVEELRQIAGRMETRPTDERVIGSLCCGRDDCAHYTPEYWQGAQDALIVRAEMAAEG